MSDMDKYAQFISNQQKTLESDGKLISEREVLINRLMAEGYTLEQIEFMIREKTETPEDRIIDALIRAREKPLRKASNEMVDDPNFRPKTATSAIKKDITLKSTLPDTVSSALTKIDRRDAAASLRRNPSPSSLTSQPSSTQTNQDWRLKMANIKAREAAASLRSRASPSAPTSDKDGSPNKTRSIGGPASTQTNQKQNLAAVARQAAIDVPAYAPIVSNSLTSKKQTDAPKPVFSNIPPESPPRPSNVNAVFDKRLVGKNTSDAIGGNPPEPATGYEGGPPTRVRIDPGSGGVGRFVLGDGKYTGSYALPGSKTMSAPVGSPDPGDIDNIPKTPQSPKSAAKSPATPAVTPAQGARAAAKSRSGSAPSAKPRTASGNYGTLSGRPEWADKAFGGPGAVDYSMNNSRSVATRSAPAARPAARPSVTKSTSAKSVPERIGSGFEGTPETPSRRK